MPQAIVPVTEWLLAREGRIAATETFLDPRPFLEVAAERPPLWQMVPA